MPSAGRAFSSYIGPILLSSRLVSDSRFTTKFGRSSTVKRVRLVEYARISTYVAWLWTTSHRIWPPTASFVSGSTERPDYKIADLVCALEARTLTPPRILFPPWLVHRWSSFQEPGIPQAISRLLFLNLPNLGITASAP